jgi:hypothetical protein
VARGFFGCLLPAVLGGGPTEKALSVSVNRGRSKRYYRNVSVVRSRGLYIKRKDRLENRAYV